MNTPLLLLLALLFLAATLPEVEAGITEIPLPDGYRQPLNLAFDDAGALWFTLDGSWGLGRYDLEDQNFSMAKLRVPKMSPQDSLFGLQIAPDGTVWAGSQSHLHRIGPSDLNVTSFALPTPSQLTGGIWISPENDVWYALVAAGMVVRLDPQTGTFDAFPIAEEQVGPTMFEQRGDRVWMTVTYAGGYATFDPETGSIGTGPREVFAAPVGLAADDGGLWVAEHGANTLGRVDLQAGRILHYPASPSPHYPFAGPNDVLVAQDSSVWFAQHLGERIARLLPDEGVLYEHEVPSSPRANVLFLAEAPDGSIWYASWSKHVLGRVTFEDAVPPPPLPERLVVAPGGTVRAEVPTGYTSVGLPRPEVNGTVRDGVLEIRAGGISAGEYLVLVSGPEGDHLRGRYLTLQVTEQEAAPGLGTVFAVLLLGALARCHRWR